MSVAKRMTHNLKIIHDITACPLIFAWLYKAVFYKGFLKSVEREEWEGVERGREGEENKTKQSVMFSNRDL